MTNLLAEANSRLSGLLVPTLLDEVWRSFGCWSEEDHLAFVDDTYAVEACLIDFL